MKNLSSQLERVVARIAQLPAEFQGRVAKAGVVGAEHYEDGTPVAYVAAIQEFGAPERGIPARPFFRPTIAEQRDEWAGLLADGARAVIRGATTAEDVLEGVGLQAAGDIRAKIASIQEPKLSPITLLLRKYRRENPGAKVGAKLVGQIAAEYAANQGIDLSGVSTKPLVDSGLLLQSIQNTVGAPD